MNLGTLSFGVLFVVGMSAASAAAAAKMGVHFSNGQEVTRIVDNMVNAPADTLAKLRAVLGK